MASSYVLDSFALLAHFEDEAGGEYVRKLLRLAERGKATLYLSVINLGEIYYNTMRERDVQKAEEVKFIIEQLPVTLVNADKEAALEAARLKGLFPVAYADCFAAALGIQKSAQVVTGDPEFRKFGERIRVAWG